MKRDGPLSDSRIDLLDVMVFAALFGILIVGFGVPILIGARSLSARLFGLGLAFWGLFAGLGGLLLVLFWTITEHADTQR